MAKHFRAMSTPWENIFGLDLNLAAQLVSEQFPEQAKSGVSYLGEGWDSLAFRCGDWVFRFPKRQEGVVNLGVELANLPHLHMPLLEGEATAEFPYLFLGTKFCSGLSLENFPGCRQRLAGELGAYLQGLHSRSRPSSLPNDVIDRLGVERRFPIIEQHLGFLPCWLESLEPLPDRMVWNHGDLYCLHVFVDSEGGLEDLIDWGDMHWGHPAVDLSCAFSFFEESDRNVFWESYGEVAENERNWAKFRSLYSSLVVRDYARSVGRPALVREAEAALARVLVGDLG